MRLLDTLFAEFEKSKDPLYQFQQICNKYNQSSKDIVKYIKQHKKDHVIMMVLDDFIEHSKNSLRIFYTHEYFNIFLVLCRLNINIMRNFYYKIKDTKIFDEYQVIFDQLKLAIDIVKNENKLLERIEKLEFENESKDKKIEELELQIKYMPYGEEYEKAKENFEALQKN